MCSCVFYFILLISVSQPLLCACERVRTYPRCWLDGIEVNGTLCTPDQSGDRTVATMLARELVGSKKAKNRMHESKAQMNSVSMQLKENLAMAKMAGCLSQSTQVMAAMNNLVRVDQIQGVMMSMSQEMMRAGIIEDMIDDTLDDLDMDSDIEEEAEDEVNKILFELTEGALGQLEDVGTSELPIATSTEPVEPVSAEASMESDSADLDDMQARLAALS